MRRIVRTLLLVGIVAAPLSAAPGLLLHDVTVVNPGHEPEPHRDVAIDDGKIVSITPAAQHPVAARVLDLPGRFVLPGFVDMHAHILLHHWNPEGGIAPRWDRSVVLAELRLLLSEGVTTVRDPGSETEAAITFRRLAAERKIASPEIYTAGRIINGSNFSPEPFITVHNEEEMRREVRWQADAGVDFIKVYSALPPDLVKVAIQEAHARGIPVIGHLQRTTWTEAAKMGIDAIAHAAPWSVDYLPATRRAGYDDSLFGRVYWLNNVDFDGPQIREMIAEIVNHHVTIDPTLIAFHTKFFGNQPRWLQNPDNALVPAIVLRGWPAGAFTSGWTEDQYRAAQAAWPKLLDLTRRLYEAGVLLTTGTDMPTPWVVPGASLHDEMLLLHSAGIPNVEVLKMATSNAAKALRRDKEIGTVAATYRANLVVLTKNPLDNLSNSRSIELVIKEGTLFDPLTLREH